MRKRIVILGSTGSIGQQTLEVIQKYPDEFEVVGLSGWENTKLLQEQISFFKPKITVVKNEAIAGKLKRDLNRQNNIKIMGDQRVNKYSNLGRSRYYCSCDNRDGVSDTYF